jgi:hypothetical protein
MTHKQAHDWLTKQVRLGVLICRGRVYDPVSQTRKKVYYKKI